MKRWKKMGRCLMSIGTREVFEQEGTERTERIVIMTGGMES
jgi:hypothetical protein